MQKNLLCISVHGILISSLEIRSMLIVDLRCDVSRMCTPSFKLHVEYVIAQIMPQSRCLYYSSVLPSLVWSGEASLGYIRRYGKPSKPNWKRKVRVLYRLYLHVTIEKKIKHYTLTSNMMSNSGKKWNYTCDFQPTEKNTPWRPRAKKLVPVRGLWMYISRIQNAI